MHSKSKHINYLAILLSWLLLFAFTFKATHSLFENEHEEKHICKDHESEKHLHNYHEHHECFICTFAFSVFQFKNWALNLKNNKVVTPEKALPEYHFANYSFINSCPSLRGPPFI
jgi:hypothetical protein